MLTADQLDALTGPITDLYEQYNQSVINDISRRLAKMGKVTETAAWQMQRLIESGKVYENALKELAKTSGLSEVEMRKMFEAAGVKAMRFDDSIYKAAGLNPLPLNLSPAMDQVLAAGLRKTNGVVKNLTMTTAINAQHSFIQAADLAYMQVAGGAMSYDQAIRAAILNVAENGLHTINYTSGHKDKLDVAMRRTVLTGVSQTTGNLQIARADEMGTDLVQTSAHIGARPAHQIWQGKVFSRSGRSKAYPDFVLSTGYGTGAGLCGWNCRHSFYPFFEGISENAYNQAELDSFADKTVTYNGKEIPIYDATQMQRGIERKIRHWKRQEGAYEAAGLDNDAETAKVKEWQARMRDFIKQTGLQRQNVREQVVGAGKAATSFRGTAKGISSALGKQLPIPQALGADVSKHAVLRTLRINQLSQMGESGLQKTIDRILTPTRIPEEKYHFEKWGERAGFKNFDEYQKSFEKHLQNKNLRFFSGIGDKDHRMWYILDMDSGFGSVYDETNDVHFSYMYHSKPGAYQKFLDNSPWLVEVDPKSKRVIS